MPTDDSDASIATVDKNPDDEDKASAERLNDGDRDSGTSPSGNGND